MLMKGTLINIRGNDLTIGTWFLSKGFDLRHNILKDLIEKYRDKFEQIGELQKVGFYDTDGEIKCDSEGRIQYIKPVMNTQRKRGGQVEQFVLNEEQYVFLGTLLPNSDKVTEFKFKLTREFFRMRKYIISLMAQQKNLEWLEKRKLGKEKRNEETLMIKNFIEYAKQQGSERSGKYYMQITKMQNQSLFPNQWNGFPGDNLRDTLSIFDLDVIKISDAVVENTIKLGMENGKQYKQIYQDIKLQTEALSISLGRTPYRLQENLKELK